jgi:hypothetical protein
MPILAALALALAQQGGDVVTAPDRFAPLTEPPCSYVSTQHRKDLVREDDAVVAWIRGAHNGGAIPLRHFLAAPRVINDTYGLFLYDADGGYVSVFPKDYGYRFHGWRRGAMVVAGPDGTLWSALSGRAFEGPKQGQQLERVPSFTTQWGYWRMLHPESTAYDLFDGGKYPLAELPTALSDEAQRTMGEVDARLAPLAMVLGVRIGEATMAFPLDGLPDRACLVDKVAGRYNVAVFWYAPTRSAVSFSAVLDERKFDFYADDVSPETAPIKDKQTETRWTLAGRAVDGPLKGRELRWVDGVQCRWYAWAAEYPQTEVHGQAKK